MARHARTSKKILVVEDDPWSRTVTSALLASEGYDVVEAKNGEEGLQLAAAHRPDVMLLDIALPRMSGTEVLHALRADRATAEIPVVIVSAYADLLSDDAASQANGVVQKPFDYDELLRHVKSATGTRVAATLALST